MTRKPLVAEKVVAEKRLTVDVHLSVEQKDLASYAAFANGSLPGGVLA